MKREIEEGIRRRKDLPFPWINGISRFQTLLQEIQEWKQHGIGTKTNTDQWNQVEDRDINRYTYGHLNF